MDAIARTFNDRIGKLETLQRTDAERMNGHFRQIQKLDTELSSLNEGIDEICQTNNIEKLAERIKKLETMASETHHKRLGIHDRRLDEHKDWFRYLDKLANQGLAHHERLGKLEQMWEDTGKRLSITQEKVGRMAEKIDHLEFMARCEHNHTLPTLAERVGKLEQQMTVVARNTEGY